MATLDVEALLDATAKPSPDRKPKNFEADDRSRGDRSERRDRDRSRGDRDRDRDYDRKRRDRRDHSATRSRRGTPDDYKASTPRSDAGSHKSRRRSRSRDDDRHHSRRHRGLDGDHHYRNGRGGRRSRSRSRSPNRHYRPRDDYRDRRDRGDHRHSGEHRRGKEDERHEQPRKRDGTPPLTEDERDRRTVFVQQLAARLRTRELKEFFEKVGAVTEAQIVKDRISQRSKGYVHSPPPTQVLHQATVADETLVSVTLNSSPRSR